MSILVFALLKELGSLLFNFTGNCSKGLAGGGGAVKAPLSTVCTTVEPHNWVNYRTTVCTAIEPLIGEDTQLSKQMYAQFSVKISVQK